MSLNDLTNEDWVIEIAQVHSRMVEVAITRGNLAMAHRAVDRAFEMLAEPRETVGLDTSLEDLFEQRMCQILARVGISTVGELCEHSRDSLVLIRHVNHRSVDRLEQVLAKNGFALRMMKGIGDGNGQ